MKKKPIVLVSLALAFSLVGCSNSDQEESQGSEIKSYFNKYEEISNYGDDTGYVYRLDDGSEMGIAISVAFNDKQAQEYYDLDFFSDTYDEDLINIVEESTECVVTDLNEYTPDDDEFEQYIGKTVGDMLDAGYMDMGYSLQANGSIFFLEGEMYGFQVVVEETIDVDNWSDDLERTLTISEIQFNDFSSSFYWGLMITEE